MAPVPELSFDKVRASIDPLWIWEALLASGTASIRRRRLPADQVIWLVLGIALERNRPIDEVVRTLGLALPSGQRATAGVAKSSIAQARVRLGDEPMQWLFDICAEHWALASAGKHRWRGLHLFGMDGTTLRVPDSEENREHFGSQNAGGERGLSGYPLVRMVTLMALRSHLLLGAQFGPYSRGENSYASQLWPKTPVDSLLVLDRGFLAAGMLIPLRESGRHWLTRAKKGLSWRVIESVGKEGDIVEMDVSDQARRNDPSLPQTWRMRAIPYQRRGFPPQILLTSLLDPRAFPAKEVIELYHERWEIELGYDEVKTEMLEREETLRSKSPTLVNQELWGLLVIYNLVRLEIERAAELAGVPPKRISFVWALRLIRDEWRWASIASGPGSIPKKLLRMREEVARSVLPPRRSGRSYPRAVKIKMSNYARKRPNVRPPK